MMKFSIGDLLTVYDDQTFNLINVPRSMKIGIICYMGPRRESLEGKYCWMTIHWYGNGRSVAKRSLSSYIQQNIKDKNLRWYPV